MPRRVSCRRNRGRSANPCPGWILSTTGSATAGRGWPCSRATRPRYDCIIATCRADGTTRNGLTSGFSATAKPWKHSVRPSPVAFEVQDKSAGQDGARLILSGERDVLIAASGLGIQLGPVQKEYTFEKLVREDERTWSTRWGEWTVHLVMVEGSFAGMRGGRWEAIPNEGKCRVAIRIFKGAPTVLPEDWKKVEAATLADWRQFSRKMPGVPQRYEVEAGHAWLNTWYAMAPATPPNFPTAPVLMAKARMNALWPWDCCFNALALGVTDLDAGLDQLMLPFARQQDDGQLPDKTGPDDAFLGCTKPPIQGWALGKLMDMHPIPNTRLEIIYPKLVVGTEFWFT